MNRIRQRENQIVWRAGVLSLLVHGFFFGLLVMTFSLKSVQPMQVAEVELWDSLPVQPVHKVEPRSEPPKPEPKVEPKPEPAPEPKAEIQIKPKPPVKLKPEPKPEPKPKKEEPPKPDPRKEEAKRLEDLKRAMLAEDDPSLAQKQEAQQIAAAKNAQAQAAASSGAVDEYRARIQAKIKRFVNRQVCGSGKPVLEFSISLMPTGEVVGTPRLQKSSNIAACDQAVERAILQAQPLPVPREPELFAQLRDLNLKFRPNDDN
jgi:colicin import membrane protein